MHWQQDFIAVDWGTTNRRACRLVEGEPHDSFTDNCGLLVVPEGDFPQAVADIRRRLGDLPMLLAGMVGSSRGWRETPYVACPATADDLARGIVWIDQRTGIVPGVSQTGAHGPDVMRGEEVQLVGAMATEHVRPRALVCHPGTHSKWILVDGGRIVRFRTMMTGELFSLLREHSILSPAIADEPAPDAEFDAGVAQMVKGQSLLGALFQIRARTVLGSTSGAGASRASGILIGSDVVAALDEFPDLPITLIGRPDLCELYARALEQAGRESATVDGNTAFFVGIACLARSLT